MAARFAEWEKDQLPEPPAPAVGGGRLLGSLIGPGLLLVGANIGGGEWLFGLLVTAQAYQSFADIAVDRRRCASPWCTLLF